MYKKCIEEIMSIHRHAHREIEAHTVRRCDARHKANRQCIHDTLCNKLSSICLKQSRTNLNVDFMQQQTPCKY